MGVKSLWTLLSPIGRPVLLENMEGKAMAIDSSIWIYQFQATMRDKDGRALVNAHVLGFLRRISKLLFYGIRPVFVFDGGAPALKRTTLNERKKKKSGAASSHAKLAEKLLAAQMRREALNHTRAQPGSKPSKGKGPPRNITLDDNTVYLEDIDGSGPKTPVKRKPPTPSSSLTKKNKFYDHDPYRLPEVDLEKAVSEATASAVPEPRLPTEDELRDFIEEMRPEDFDVTSPAFRELPTEVQYEIIGDLRLKSRQTSYARLQKMLQSTRTPLDFSKQQIQNLKKRNALTQQLLVTTDTIGSAHIAIPIRIASERNKEYVLVKNEGEFGGWILGIKDTGTREKPILIDHEEKKEVEGDSDADMEEIEVSANPPADPDLRSYQQEMALSAISRRSTSNNPRPLRTRRPDRRTMPVPLFLSDEDGDGDGDDGLPQQETLDDADDNLLAFAIQESLDQVRDAKTVAFASSSHQPPSLPHQLGMGGESSLDEDDFYADFSPPNRLQTHLSIANATPSHIHASPTKPGGIISPLGEPSSLTSSSSITATTPQFQSGSDEEMEEVFIRNAHVVDSNKAAAISAGPALSTHTSLPTSDTPPILASSKYPPSYDLRTFPGSDQRISSATNKTVEVLPPEPTAVSIGFGRPVLLSSPTKPSHPAAATLIGGDHRLEVTSGPLPSDTARASPTPLSKVQEDSDIEMEEVSVVDALASTRRPSQHTSVVESLERGGLTRDSLFIPSRSPSPFEEVSRSRPASPSPAEDWDAAEEMDINAEEGEFARFMSQVKGRDLDDVRQEIDDEINILNQQRKAAMRDSEDITQQMISQIMTMLRLFGIPYITAPMEAEAQCAELVTLGLVNGVITDDSDVFLFGAQRVYKNMFNQSKTVECFLLTDLERELSLDRDTLIQLAYLLGSDYTEGLSGVGPVVAMELLKEFPGHNGLHKFKDWWLKVQSGKDGAGESQSKFRRQFKKRFKDLFLSSDWPNSVVRDAYYHPTVDSSDEPFKWALPDLDGLREFLRQELSWQQPKVDDLLLPIIQKMNKRGQADALNRQGNLNEFFDVTAGVGTYAPRQRQAYASKRLQQVITDFRKQQKNASSTPAPSGSGSAASGGSGSEDEREKAPARKRKRISVSGKGKQKATGDGNAGPPATSAAKGKGRGRGRGRGQRGAQPSARRAKTTNKQSQGSGSGDDSDEYAAPAIDSDAAALNRTTEFNLRPRPKPRPIRSAKPLDEADNTGIVEDSSQPM